MTTWQNAVGLYAMAMSVSPYLCPSRWWTAWN